MLISRQSASQLKRYCNRVAAVARGHPWLCDTADTADAGKSSFLGAVSELAASLMPM